MTIREIKEEFNGFLLQNIQGVLVSWAILIIFILTDKFIRTNISLVSTWSGLIGTTLVMILIIVIFSIISSKICSKIEINNLSLDRTIENNLYWIVPIVYLIWGIILNLIYSNIEPSFLKQLLEIPFLGSIISFVQ